MQGKKELSAEAIEKRKIKAKESRDRTRIHRETMLKRKNDLLETNTRLRALVAKIQSERGAQIHTPFSLPENFLEEVLSIPASVIVPREQAQEAGPSAQVSPETWKELWMETQALLEKELVQDAQAQAFEQHDARVQELVQEVREQEEVRVPPEKKARKNRRPA